jgi:hypothetical protein
MTTLVTPAEIRAMAEQRHADNVDRFEGLVALAEAWLATRPPEVRTDRHDAYWAANPQMTAAFSVLERWLHEEDMA